MIEDVYLSIGKALIQYWTVQSIRCGTNGKQASNAIHVRFVSPEVVKNPRRTKVYRQLRLAVHKRLSLVSLSAFRSLGLCAKCQQGDKRETLNSQS